MKETIPSKPELHKSFLAETNARTRLEGGNTNGAVVGGGTTNKTAVIIGALCCLLLLPLIGGITYLLLDMPASNGLSSISEGAPERISTDDSNEIVFQPSIMIGINSETDDDKDIISGSSSLALVNSRAKLSNFNWGANTFLTKNQVLPQGNRIRRKPGNTAFYLQQQGDGNLVLYNENSRVFWASGVVNDRNSDKKYYTVLQGDGNLVTYSRINNKSPHVEWASNRQSRNDRYNLVLTPDRDGLMIARRDDGQIIWTKESGSSSGSSGAVPAASSSNKITYVPGKLNQRQNGLRLSEGLRSRIVAQTGEKVVLDGDNNKKSKERFHAEPDGAGVFEDPETGGWVYVSNSEVKEPRGRGGVGGIYFDRNGRTTNYRMLQEGTTANCSGGKTPWNTWGK